MTTLTMMQNLIFLAVLFIGIFIGAGAMIFWAYRHIDEDADEDLKRLDKVVDECEDRLKEINDSMKK